MARESDDKGVSLAKGPVLIVGIALLALGVLGLIFGGRGFDNMNPIDGITQGDRFLGIEANGMSNLLFAGAGALLIFGSPLHWGAKSLSLIVGLVLGAASVIAMVDGDDVFGIFAANGPTMLVWGVAAAVLLVLALLPRVGGGKKDDRDRVREEPRHTTRTVERQTRTVEREPEPVSRFDRETAQADDRSSVGSSRVVAPADGSTPESRETTRRQRDL